jgi:hypothetical protein
VTLVTWAEAVSINFRKSAGSATLTFEAGREYVLAQQQFQRITQEAQVAQRVFKVSRIEARIPNFHVLARKPGPQRLLLYNGAGGYGDQIMTWPFARILTTYGFEVHILADPGNQTCWWNFPWIKSIQSLPMQYEHFRMYDYWVMFEAVVNTDEHQDQIHPLDTMLNKVGIDPGTVDPKLKVVRPNFTYLETLTTQPFQNKQIGLYQLSAANQVRCLPPSDAAFLLTKIADAWPNIHWLALYDEFIPEPYRAALACPKCGGKGKVQAVADLPPGVVPSIVNGTVTGYTGTGRIAAAAATLAQPAMSTLVDEGCPKCSGTGTVRPNIQLYCAPALRELWALTAKAAVVIAPDSLMVHAAGCQDVPCVGLWGLVNPANRTKYYKNHAAIWKREACPFSPCYAYGGQFPRYCPPRPSRSVCECLGAISPADVIEAVKKIIPRPTT